MDLVYKRWLARLRCVVSGSCAARSMRTPPDRPSLVTGSQLSAVQRGWFLGAHLAWLEIPFGAASDTFFTENKSKRKRQAPQLIIFWCIVMWMFTIWMNVNNGNLKTVWNHSGPKLISDCKKLLSKLYWKCSSPNTRYTWSFVMVCMKQRAIFWALDFLQSHDRVLAHLRPRRKNLSTNIWSAQPGDTSGFPGALRHSNILSTSRQLPSNNCLQTGSSTYLTWRWIVDFPQILFPPRS